MLARHLVILALIGASAAGQTLSPRALENLTALARLFGDVRYFHPSDESAAADWDALAIEGARAVEGLTDNSQLAARLTELLAKAAPAVRISTQGPEASGAPAERSLVAWRHTGFQGANSPGGAYHSERVPSGPVPPLRTELLPGLWAEIPLAMAASTTPPPPVAPRIALVRDRAVRFAAVTILWNVFQHFYPNFDELSVDWPAELSRALTSAATDADELAFGRTLKRMVAPLRDGHIHVTHPLESGRVYSPAVKLAWADGGYVVTRSHVDGVRPGDRILSVDGRPVDALAAGAAELTSSPTPQYLHEEIARTLLTGQVLSTATVEIESAGEKQTRILTRDTIYASPELIEPRPQTVAELKPGLLYIDFTRITDPEFLAALPRLEKARGIVFDLRGYPNRVSAFEALSHLTETPLMAMPMLVPILTRPDRVEMELHKEGWTVEPKSPFLAAPKIFLSDGRGISQTETWLALVEQYRLGRIVGGATAGTNGNVTSMLLPGNYRVIWTEMKVTRFDGSRHNGVGIPPSVAVEPTRAAIAQGRDEVLERAIALLEQSR